jgi:hypothetical protein
MVAPRERFLVVVRDFDLVGIAILPSEANAILFVHPDAVLSRTVVAQPLETITWRSSQFTECLHPVMPNGGGSCQAHKPNDIS